jgi:hypothetical protein
MAAGQQTPPASTTGLAGLAGYVLAFAGIMLLASSGVGMLRQRPGIS